MSQKGFRGNKRNENRNDKSSDKSSENRNDKSPNQRSDQPSMPRQIPHHKIKYMKADKKRKFEEELKGKNIGQELQKLLREQKELNEKISYLSYLQMKEKTVRVYKDKLPLINLIKKYDSCDPYEKRKNVPNFTITILHVSENIFFRAKELFPYVEGGYFGRPGDCILDGKIVFTAEEEKLLRKYFVSWKYEDIKN